MPLGWRGRRCIPPPPTRHRAGAVAVDAIRSYLKGLQQTPFPPVAETYDVPEVTSDGPLRIVDMAARGYLQAVNVVLSSAALSAPVTAACAISTGVSERDVEPRDCCAGASDRVDVIARFCQPPGR